MKSKLKFIAIILIPLLFFLSGIYTLPDYGVNWDNAMHYDRGHAYLHYFLTGETNYLNLPKHSSLDESVDFKDIRGEYMQLYKDSKRSDLVDDSYRRSYYESDVFNFEYFKEKDSGHPPLNGILAAATNYIFYQKLGILGDLYSHQLFGIIVATLLVLGVSVFAFYVFGIFPALVATSALVLYPLFLGESHFNIKDPVLASFFGLTIISIYFGIVKKKIRILLLGAIFAGLSLGTKFNTLFMPLILGPWMIFYWWRVNNLKVKKKTFLILLICGVIPLIMLFLAWPYLWFNGLNGLVNIFKYYAEEGTGTIADLSRFRYFGFNLFPISWITLTTPIPVLILSGIGIFWLLQKLIKEKDHTALLIILWLFVPILRVTVPDTTIYGGVRHIMEFIPALAITSGAGCYFLLKRFYKINGTIIFLVAFMMLLVLLEMLQIHPNQNVYFNQLIGGLSGAKKNNIPYWGNSFGNAYQQGIKWLNQNAQKNAKLGLPIGGTVNLPRENIRADIDLHNDNFSAFTRSGEYEIEMTHDGLPKNSFTYAYLENFLEPVYEVKVDDVPILKVWKNDLIHTKPEFKKEKAFPVQKISQEKNQLKIELESITLLTRLYINHDKKNCSDVKNGNVLVSENGARWEALPDPLSYPQMQFKTINAKNNDFTFLFAGKSAKFILINLPEVESCLLKNPVVEVWGLDNPN